MYVIDEEYRQLISLKVTICFFFLFSLAAGKNDKTETVALPSLIDKEGKLGFDINCHGIYSS